MKAWRRLRKKTFGRVNQNDGEVRGGSSRGHVAGVLLVAGRVRDDEFPVRGAEVTVSDVNGDALLALGAQAVRQQGKINGSARAVDAAFLHGVELVFIDRFAVVQQPADQSRFTVIHAARGGEAKELLMEFLLEEEVQIVLHFEGQGGGHQK